MTRLVLVRHGETVWHKENRYTGRSDVALTDLGRRQAAQLAEWAKHNHLDGLWASPLSRARRTAQAVAEATGLPLHIDARLRELDFGAGEGLTSAEMAQRFPEQRAAFERDPVAHHLPDGEDPRDAVARAAEALREIVAHHPDGHVLLVGHSTLKRLLLCHLLGLPLARYRGVFPVVRNCAPTTLRWNGHDPAALVEFNTPVDLPVFDPAQENTP